MEALLVFLLVGRATWKLVSSPLPTLKIVGKVLGFLVLGALVVFGIYILLLALLL